MKEGVPETGCHTREAKIHSLLLERVWGDMLWAGNEFPILYEYVPKQHHPQSMKSDKNFGFKKASDRQRVF